ncbi:hypothetical protein [Actinoplanes sp. NPDC026670]
MRYFRFGLVSYVCGGGDPGCAGAGVVSYVCGGGDPGVRMRVW